jgi:hypothetical protein
MTDCERLSDRMPEVALGRESWSPEDEAHLAACADCRAEWEVVRTASRLEWPGLGVAPSAIADSALGRVRADRARSHRRRTWAVIALTAAAAAVLAVWTGRRSETARGPESRPVENVAAAPRLQLPIPELDDLDGPELDSLLQRMDAPVTGTSTLDSPSLGDLDDHELERVLSAWEG